MQVDVLGPLRASDDSGRAFAVTGARLRTLLLRLAIDGGRPVSAAALADAVWAGEQPADATNALQTLVSRLRRTLGGAGTVIQSTAGYQLALAPDEVDAHRFTALVAAGRDAVADGRHEHAAATFADALALWRGDPLTDAGPDPSSDLVAEAGRLTELHAEAVLDRATAHLALGRPASSMIAGLEALRAARPLDERVAGTLMRVLAADGRQSHALAVFEQVRARLADELGVDPGAALQAAHLDVLRGSVPQQVALPRRTNLTAQLTSFVGRDEDVTRIRKLLEVNRLVTLVGPGGAGKTRLASEALAGIVEDVPDGVWFVGLAPVSDPGDIAQTVLGSLGVRDAHLLDSRTQQLSVRDTRSRLLDALTGKQLVLVLDNCEHLVDACAEIADDMLGHCADLRVLATSREPLGITGEALLPVSPLGRPRAGEPASDALGYPAVRLFADRAAAVAPDFSVDDESVALVIEIVNRLDGMPLAIELAAARLRTLPLDEIAERLSDRFRLLTGGSRTALPRHRTLRAVVEWSWELLTPAERRLAEWLAVFPAGATKESATAVCADGDAVGTDVPELLSSLVDKSLLQRDGDRFRMLETIREFGIERLAERGDLADVRARHAAHFADVVRESDEHVRTAGQLPWMRLLDAERENVLAALRHLIDVGDAQQTLELAAAIGGYWMFTGAHLEASLWLEHALAVDGPADPDVRLLVASMLVMTSFVRPHDPDGADGADGADAGAARLQELNEHFAVADISRHPMLALMRPVIAMFAEDDAGVQDAIDDALASDDAWVRASARMLAANVAENRGDVEAMRTAVALARTEFEVLGERWGLASTLQMSAQLRTFDGDLNGAAADARRALDLAAELGTHDDEAWLNLRLADVELRRGNTAEATRLAQRGRDLSEATGVPWLGLFGRAWLADIAFRSGEWDEGHRMLADVVERLNALPPLHPLQSQAVAVVHSIVARHRLADDEATARAHLVQAAQLAVGTMDLQIVGAIAVVAAYIAVHDGEPAAAARLLGVAHQLRGAADPTHPDVAELSGLLRRELGAAPFQVEYDGGRQLDRDDALAVLRSAAGLPAS